MVKNQNPELSRIQHFREEISEFWKSYRRSKLGLAGLVLFLFFVAVAFAAPLIAPYDPFSRVGPPFGAPSLSHILGTNDAGQDIFSELLYGTRTSLLVGISAALIVSAFGTIVGLVAGYFGGIIENTLMRITDIFLLVPDLPFIMILALYLGPSVWNIVLAIGILWWSGTARVIRSIVLTIKEEPFIEAAKAIGASNRHIMLSEILPHTIPVIIVGVIRFTGFGVLYEAGLSFLGLGDPTAKSWGTMLHFAQARGAFLRGMWWWFFPPGLCISLTIISFTLISFSLDRILNPKMRGMGRGG
jgi:ABC-type dipeptide/oligopeptide/nickel transport system permease subunit